MALIHLLFLFVAVCAFSFAAASLGNLILRMLHLEMDTDAQHLLIDVGVGIIFIEMLLFGVEISQQIREGCYVVAGLLCFVLLAEYKPIAQRCHRVLRAIVSISKMERFLLLLVGIAICLESLASLAPLTGSDALHYHFTTQKLVLEYGFHPNFSLALSFFCGQQHLLILFGLAFRSEQLAMGLIFLGGVLTTCSLACLASRWSSLKTALAIILLFLLTPVVFWQISSSGAPDIWMAFFASAAVIVLYQNGISGTWGQALLAGLLAGGIAGAKYTGCFVAVGLMATIAIEYRSIQRVLQFCLGSVFTGIWPYFRNFLWTGDPVFPFLTKTMTPERVNSFALASLRAHTGASHQGDLGRLIPFIFFAGIRRVSPGLWDFFGPFVFAFAPLLTSASDKFRSWRVPAVVWSISSLGVFYASGLQRLLLPVFPLALACTVAGIESCQKSDWKIVTHLVKSLTIFLWIAGASGMVVYSWKAIGTSLGIVNAHSYLEERAPEYQIAEVINGVLAGETKRGKALVFLRHNYYLNVPFLNGDPATSWIIDPDRLRTPHDWEVFFQKEGIAYVVRSPSYPPAIAAPLAEMEDSGDLKLIARSVVQDFRGKRIQDNRTEITVDILRVENVIENQTPDEW